MRSSRFRLISRRRLELPCGSPEILEAEGAGECILGFVTGGPVRARARPIVGDLSGVTAEVSLLYVLPEEMGKGLGRALFGRAVQRLAGLGHPALVVWAYRANPYLTFYERLSGVAAAESDWQVEGRFFPTRGYVWRDLPALVEACGAAFAQAPEPARERGQG